MAACNKLKDAAEGSPFENTMIDWLPLIIALIPSASETLGTISVMNILLPELFPTDIRSISVGIVEAMANVAVYCSMMVYPIASGAGAFFELMLGYGVISAFMTVWAIFTIQDTDNMSLVEIENSFRKGKTQNNAHMGSKATESSGLQSQELVESAPLLKDCR